MVDWNNVWPFLVTVWRLVVGCIAFVVHHRYVRLWPPRDSPIVTVRQGKLRGAAGSLPNGQRYHYFKGVPYATAPVGKLRFHAPLALERYSAPIVDCFAERSDCIQLDFFSGLVYGAESGLYLNIYTPCLPRGRGGKRPVGLPVMVFLHGGGFACGSGSSLFYTPEYFLQRDVLVVTVNYRLGPFGFLCLPEAGIAGNAGLKDQLMALRWVHENIAQFGGDRHCVTLFGESAGSFSAFLHMLSPNSRRYFHRVICQSGVVCTSSFMQANAVGMALNLARYFGYNGNSQQGALETLQKVPAKLLAKHQRKAIGQSLDRQSDLVFVFLPVVEQTPTEDSIITEAPETILKSYDTLQIPLLEGCNDAEGILGLYILQRKRPENNQLMLEHTVAKIFRHLAAPERREVVAEIKQFYFGNAPPDRWGNERLKHLLSDVIFMNDSAVSAEWLAKYQPHLPHYHYRFTYDGRFSMLKRLFQNATISGACHGDDVFYMFSPKFLPTLAPTSDEHRVRDIVLALWTSFARHGDPSIDSQNVTNVQWRPLRKISRDTQTFELDCLEINVHPAMVKNPDRDRLDFWRRLFQRHSKGFL